MNSKCVHSELPNYDVTSRSAPRAAGTLMLVTQKILYSLPRRQESTNFTKVYDPPSDRRVTYSKLRTGDPQFWSDLQDSLLYRGADKSLARPGRKQATATEDFDVHISYLQS